ncbi:MAG: histidine phosphotransferase [Alphaproteobacteria bacterium]|nr:histidine phosphotransferase [Alphaproteobacteria bacterium]
MTAVDFASLLCSRLCHDLVGPVGALYNGIELLADEDDPEMRQRCIELVADSARQTSAKLKFFRLAFGAAGGFGAEVDTREAQAALEGLYAGDARIELGWLVEADSLPKGAVRILLVLAMTAGDALLRGGRLSVAAERHAGGLELAVRAEGARVLLDDEVRAAIEGRTAVEAVTPRAAPGFLVRCLVDEARGKLKVSAGDGMLVFGVTLAG